VKASIGSLGWCTIPCALSFIVPLCTECLGVSLVVKYRDEEARIAADLQVQTDAVARLKLGLDQNKTSIEHQKDASTKGWKLLNDYNTKLESLSISIPSDADLIEIFPEYKQSL